MTGTNSGTELLEQTTTSHCGPFDSPITNNHSRNFMVVGHYYVCMYVCMSRALDRHLMANRIVQFGANQFNAWMR